MRVIGELINGMYLNVSRAVNKEDEKVIQKLALEQIKAGADSLDVNCGPCAKDPVKVMRWLIDVIRKVTAAKLVIDTTNFAAMEAALEKAPDSIINSTTADLEKMEKIFALARRYNSGVIALTMDKKGIPRNKDERLELAVRIITYCHEIQFDISRLYLDPVILPVNVAQPQAKEVIEAVREFKILSTPPPNTIAGLSNISQRALKRPLINQTYLVMLIEAGLDAAILNPFEEGAMNALRAAELLMNKRIYCDSFLEAYGKKESGG